MCGIYTSISARGFRNPSHKLKQFLCNRGPDHTGLEQASFSSKDGTASYNLTFLSTVLALRGDHITTQPFNDHSTTSKDVVPSPKIGSVLCWNGEAWKIGSRFVVGNDGQAIYKLLVRAVTHAASASDATLAVIKELQTISGPFAFVFWDSVHSTLYCGRDRLGRRSILYNIDKSSTSIEFASIADSTHGNWKELEADGIYVLTCSGDNPFFELQDQPEISSSASPFPLQKYAWASSEEEHSSEITLGKFNRATKDDDYVLDLHSPSVMTLRHHLCESLKPRILDIPNPPHLGKHNVRLAILFSGGLDCTVLARLAHDLLPLDQDIDLLNVAFENPRVIKAAQNGPRTKKGKGPSTAQQADFANHTTLDQTHSPYELCPDRETGRKAYNELQNVCPSRKWRFIAVNIPYSETIEHKAQVIDLIYPHNTEMDLSIAFALYFASRGIGFVSSDVDATPYTTPARVLLSGLGADELFGGYTRHATAFNRHGFPTLLDELELDVNRLGKRNLGRDDRVISHWGREVRFPYLDESLVRWAVESPIWKKCGFGYEASSIPESPTIEPGKKVLRLLAYSLGMHSVAVEKKRAIQFGARTAKMEVGRTKGTTLIS